MAPSRTGTAVRSIVVDPAEATVVREVFERHAGGESNGSIATWLNVSGLRTSNDNPFTAHGIKDMLRCRFYTGVVTYMGEEFAGQHEAIISEELFERAQRRRQPSPKRRSRAAPEAALRGRLACANCGHPVHAETNAGGLVLYRERHACDCDTSRGSSVVAHRIDDAIGELFSAIDLQPDWRDRVAAAATRPGGDNVDDLRDQRRRVGRAFADGALDQTEYQARITEIDGRITSAEIVAGPDLETVAALVGDLSALWNAATAIERQQLLEPLVDRAFVDLTAKVLVRVSPAPAFGALLRAATRRTRRGKAAIEVIG